MLVLIEQELVKKGNKDHVHYFMVPWYNSKAVSAAFIPSLSLTRETLQSS
ncbi:MAG: hypothetical protein M3270_02530 [Thermoproteota archaeon]|nr:hypothetical protein [Thermoproteota archaeon]